ncbi:hypothetical protein K523DRAFT_33814 [Schizophyllum commune Tattone D]|nr:hypothetical protein K523DRAFT_33814 [Schizophyllum commune Tattone D]
MATGSIPSVGVSPDAIYSARHPRSCSRLETSASEVKLGRCSACPRWTSIPYEILSVLPFALGLHPSSTLRPRNAIRQLPQTLRHFKSSHTDLSPSLGRIYAAEIVILVLSRCAIAVRCTFRHPVFVDAHPIPGTSLLLTRLCSHRDVTSRARA